MTLEDLGRRAVACKNWRWMPGMVTACALRVVDGGADYAIGHRSGATRDGGGWYDGDASGLFPDLSDPATLGCLLALVRIAYGDPSFVVRCVAGLWYEESNKRALVARGSDTEAEALVAALEAAP